MAGQEPNGVSDDLGIECRVILDNDGVQHLHTELDALWQRLGSAVPGGVSAEWTFAVGLALGELIANASRHAYAGTPVADQWLEISVSVDNSGIRAEIRDGGGPLTNRPELTDDDDLPESGRGLLIVRGVVDDLEYRRLPDGINLWRIRKAFT